MKQLGIFIGLCLTALYLGSCDVNKNLMFKSPKGEFAISDSIPMTPSTDYQISVDDKITFALSTNEGTKLLESMSGVSQFTDSEKEGREFLVLKSGKVELPVIGEVHVDGLTIKQCEDTLEHLFSAQYREPFVQVKVTNQRVIVFPGGGSDAKVIPLVNSNTTIMEALAQAGGIAERGRAANIKLIRKEKGERKVYVIDLSTIEGLKFVDMVVQANDYIYVEPNPDVVRGIVAEIAPVLSTLASVFIMITVISNLK